jgi:Cu2+-exporting ATPase
LSFPETLEGNDLPAILVAMEQHSSHPLAGAVVAHFPGTKPAVIEQFENLTGRGVKAVFEGETYFAGNEALMQEYGVELPLPPTPSPRKGSQGVVPFPAGRALESPAQTFIWFANSHQVLAVIALADALKPTSAEAVRELQQMGIEVHILTGDNAATADAIAAQTGIAHVQAGVLPHQKADYVRALQANGQVVAMAGDGINDSAALACADVSIAMGRGSDLAMEVAHMTLLSSDLLRIPAAIRLSRQTVATIRQNLFWAFVYNVIGIPVAAGVLYPFTGFLLNPMIAGAAMALSSVSVVSNSLRLKWAK